MSCRIHPPALAPVIQLTLLVTEDGVSVGIQSLVLPYSQRPSRTRCGGILRSVLEGQTVYALACGRYTGKWGFPKGGREDGETEEECARREVDEEIGVVDLPPPACRMVLCRQVYFVFEVSVLPLRPMDTLEILEVRWMTLEEMRGVSLNAAGMAFVQRMGVSSAPAAPLTALPRVPKHRLSEESYLAVERLAKQMRLERRTDGQAFYEYVIQFFAP